MANRRPRMPCAIASMKSSTGPAAFPTTRKRSRLHAKDDHQMSGGPPQLSSSNSAIARRIGLDTQYEAIVFMHKDCQVCRSEGFAAHTRVLVRNGHNQLIATLYQVTGDLI